MTPADLAREVRERVVGPDDEEHEEEQDADKLQTTCSLSKAELG
jgi:hypothetical protein